MLHIYTFCYNINNSYILWCNINTIYILWNSININSMHVVARLRHC